MQSGRHRVVPAPLTFRRTVNEDATRTQVWYFATETAYQVYSSPVVANGMVYVGSNDHELYAFGLP
jgi:outer membrane protein assembly factor BamB